MSDLNAMRAEFEAAARKQGYNLTRTYDNNDEYAFPAAAGAWWAWQAARVQPVAAPVLTDNEKIDLFRDAMKANGCVAQLAAISFANAVEKHAVSVCGRDTARLNWLYSRKKTQSCALLDLELRMINEDYPTPQEAREAIDAAMQRGEGEKT